MGAAGTVKGIAASNFFLTKSFASSIGRRVDVTRGVAFAGGSDAGVCFDPCPWSWLSLLRSHPLTTTRNTTDASTALTKLVLAFNSISENSLTTFSLPSFLACTNDSRVFRIPALILFFERALSSTDKDDVAALLLHNRPGLVEGDPGRFKFLKPTVTLTRKAKTKAAFIEESARPSVNLDYLDYFGYCKTAQRSTKYNCSFLLFLVFSLPRLPHFGKLKESKEFAAE